MGRHIWQHYMECMGNVIHKRFHWHSRNSGGGHLMPMPYSPLAIRVLYYIPVASSGPQNHDKYRFSHTKTMFVCYVKTRFLMVSPGVLVPWVALPRLFGCPQSESPKRRP